MELKQHVKGVLIAIVSATILLFVISFFVGDEVLVEHQVVVNKSKSEVFNFLKKPDNFQKWIDGSADFDVKPLGGKTGLQYIGFDNLKHSFEYKVSESAYGLEIHYEKEGEKMAIFKAVVLDQPDGAMISYTKIWNIGGNPLSKIFSLSVDDDILEGMKKDLKQVKFELSK